MRARSVKTTRKRHKKIIKSAKGFWGGKRRLFKSAKETVAKGLMYAKRDRKAKKRDNRRLWTVRISAAVRPHKITYSRFINALAKAEIKLNRKMLAEIAATDKAAFDRLVKEVKSP